jgi:RNA polymerase sigma-70 factor (ECF subfamily)
MRPPETRHSLIVRLKDQRNNLAWTEFLCAYEPFLMRLVRKQGTPERHVADVSQQLLIAIAKSVEGWTPDGKNASFRRWLGCVARNVVIKFMMRERKQITGQGGSEFLTLLEDVADVSINADEIKRYEQELILWAAEQVRGEFRENSWRAFWETQVEGRAVVDVAKELGVKTGAVYMSRSRVFARIRNRIEEVLDEDS